MKKRKVFKSFVSIFMCILMLCGSMVFDSSIFTVGSSAANESSTSASGGNRAELNFNNNWKFNLGDVSAAKAKSFDDSSWSTVKLPHDFSISQDFTNTNTEVESGNLPTGTGWYRKMFTMPSEYASKEIYLNFDGVYNNAYIYVNGTLVAENHYGYNSFSVDIGKYITCNGSTWNLVAIKVVSEMQSSRWYSGSGIYRDVTMTIVEPVHVARHGTYVTTPSVTDDSATVNAKVTVENSSKTNESVTVRSQIFDPNGNAVATLDNSVTIAANSSSTVDFTHTVASPLLWDTDSPNLYTAKTSIIDSDSLTVDEYDTEFGIRTIEWNADTGFYLNGKSTKLKGVSMHHDQGALGAVQEYDALYRQLTILKDMGCNAIRTTHNSPSRVLIDLCNKLGFLVMEEFFDGWSAAKNGNSNDFSKYFKVNLTADNNLVGASEDLTWAQFVVKETVMRDRNDPCVFIWDCGNELLEGASGGSDFATIASSLRETVLLYDDTRKLTEGNNKVQNNSIINSVDEYMDVIGGNYHTTEWVTVKNAGTLTKPFVATESKSVITSRGIYSSKSNNYSKIDYALYSYDNSTVGWGCTAASGWYYVAANDWFSGEFVWTGFDYIGEPTPWNGTGTGSSTVPNSSYFGIVDTAGFPKDQYYLYRSWWQNNDTTLHLLPGTWNSNNLYLNNGYAYVNVYSNADNIKLYLNDTLIGTAQSTTVTTANGYTYKTWTETVVDSSNCNTNEIYSGTGHDLYAQFGVKYTEGTLSVKAYDAAGNEITDTVGTTSVTSGKSAAKIVAKVWGDETKEFVADSDSYAYIEFEAVDEDGNFVNDYYGTLNVSVNNDGVIAGVDNGFQGTTEKFQQSSVLTSDTTATIEMFSGRALAIIKTTDVANDIQVTATNPSDNLDVEGETITAREQTTAEKLQYFENYVPQSATEYTPTIYDKYEILAENFSAITEPSGSVTYEFYTVETVDGSDYVLPTGDYIIYGVATNSAAIGTVKSTTASGGLKSSGSAATASDLAWHFERRSNGKYYIYYTNDSGVKRYMNIGTANGSLSLSTTAQELDVTCTNGSFIIGSGSQYLNYYGSGKNLVSTWSTGTSLTLYTTDGTTLTAVDTSVGYINIEEGQYAIYNNENSSNRVISNTIGTDTQGTASGLGYVTGTVDGNYLTMEEDNYFIIEKVAGSTTQFYIKTADGKYININTTKNGAVTLTDTPQALNAVVLSGGKVALYAGSGTLYFLDHFVYRNIFSSWSGSTTSVPSNRTMSLYKRTANADADETLVALYNAIKNGLTYEPGAYDAASYNTLYTALEEGFKLYSDSTSTAEQRTAAAEAINAAIAGLQEFIKKFSARLIKYGYNPSNTTAPYNGGSVEYNEQTYAAMAAAIKANDDLMTQIKKIIDYDGSETTWEDGYADTALEEVVQEYAKIYSLAFRGGTVTGGTSATNFAATAWNHWQKDNTQGASESKNEGASIQGLYSKALGANGFPVSHTVYDTLDYTSGASTGTSLSSDETVTVSTGSSATKTVTLTALNNISVYVPDFFSANNVEGTTYDYTKFYWNTEFPFFVTTDSEGVNHYVYDSSDTTHLLRASYDDENQTADINYYSNSGWSVNRHYASAGQGFFPFNYQITDSSTDSDTLTGENAIYHFGMTFDMDFYIPEGGKYSKTSDDIVFSFSGDDDVLVYVDDTLVLDNGGLHGARSCQINFTEASVSYQYAMNVADKTLVSTTENDVYYKYGETYDSISDVNQTAINYLNEIKNDGKKHTFKFFYLERGSTESNCKISFNLQQISDYIKLIDQTLVADFGLPIEYNVESNNEVKEAATENGATIKYIGIADSIEKAIDFSRPTDLQEFGTEAIISRTGNYGDYTVNSDGTVTYTPKTTEFSGTDSFYMCAEIENDPTYSNGTVYYAFEKVTFVPATNIYYEEDFCEGKSGGITYTDGATPTGFDNSLMNYGVWTTVTGGDAAQKQAADLAGDSNANIYGYDPAYDNSTVYSNGTARKVTVSEKNNPNSTYSGGKDAEWPKLTFTFTGTGFDVLSLTDSTTGVFTVEVYKGSTTEGDKVKKSIVDTYYGYTYSQLYADASGNPTGTETGTPLYWTKNNTCTKTVTYYGEDGVISTTPTYYDADGNITSDETDNPAYAYAYGWIKAEGSSTDSLYQIPVISIEDLEYGTYTAVVTAMFTTMYKHYNKDTLSDGTTAKSYDLYVDGIRIYDPAGVGDDIAEKDISDAYKKDGEAYPDYIELRNMLIGADSFGNESTKTGLIFIDGIPALDNDIEKYKIAGPNNELYLASGQAVAFEVWATAVPTDLQIVAKSVKGTPTLKLTYNGKDVPKELSSATQMTYAFNSLLPVGNKLKWTQTTVDGKAYYTTGTIVLANSGEQNTILSLGRLKWNFDTTGAYGFFRIPTTETATEQVSLMATKATVNEAYSIVSSLYTKTSISSDDVTVPESSVVSGDSVVITVKTPDDVKTLLIKDENGNVVEPENVEQVASSLETETTTWNVTLSFSEAGTYVYTVTGVNEYGYEGKEGASFTVTVEQQSAPDEEKKSFLEKLQGFFEKIINFFKKLFGLYK